MWKDRHEQEKFVYIGDIRAWQDDPTLVENIPFHYLNLGIIAENFKLNQKRKLKEWKCKFSKSIYKMFINTKKKYHLLYYPLLSY